MIHSVDISPLIHDLEAGLDRISEGENIRLMDLSDESSWRTVRERSLMAFVIMIIPTGVLTWYQVRKMKTRVQQPDCQ